MADPQGDPPRPPWHFKALVAAVAAYLSWRLVQLALLVVR